MSVLSASAVCPGSEPPSSRGLTTGHSERLNLTGL